MSNDPAVSVELRREMKYKSIVLYERELEHQCMSVSLACPVLRDGMGCKEGESE